MSINSIKSFRDQGLNAVPNEGIDLKQLELDVEEILSRKKVSVFFCFVWWTLYVSPPIHLDAYIF